MGFTQPGINFIEVNTKCQTQQNISMAIAKILICFAVFFTFSVCYYQSVILSTLIGWRVSVLINDMLCYVLPGFVCLSVYLSVSEITQKLLSRIPSYTENKADDAYYWAGMVHSDCGWTCSYAGKTVRSLENTCHTWALLRWWSRRGAISSVYRSLWTLHGDKFISISIRSHKGLSPSPPVIANTSSHHRCSVQTSIHL